MQIEAHPEGCDDLDKIVIDRLYAPDRFDATARNRIGTLGAFCDQSPAEDEIRVSIDKARKLLADLAAGGPRPTYAGLRPRCVAAA